MGVKVVERYLRNAKVEESPLQNELMLFESETGRFFVLNRTMAFIWSHCASEVTFDGILATLHAEFVGAEGSSIAEEIRQALDELVRLKLVAAI